MITLQLEDYCHEGCMRFEPRVIKGLALGDRATIIACEHSAECQYMARYLKKHSLEKEKKNDVEHRSGDSALGGDTESGE